MTDRPYQNVAWNNLPDGFRELVLATLTQRQLTAYQLRQGGMKLRDISRTMDVSLSTVQGTLARADQKIEIALRRQEAAA